MTRRKVYTFLGMGVLLIASLVQGLAYVHSTVAKYSNGAPCDLTGVPRLLQMAFFIQPGGCKAPNKGKCDNAACTLSNPASGSSTKGHCGLDVASTNCVCLAN